MEENNSNIIFTDEIEISKKKSKVKTLGKILVIAFGFIMGLFALLMLMIIAFISLNGGDIQKIDDSILMPSSKIIPKEDNAFYDFKQAMDNAYWPTEKGELFTNMANGSYWDDNSAKEVVEKNKAALVFVENGTRKIGFQDPLLQGDLKADLKVDTILTSLSGLRSLAYVQIIKSKLLMKNGNEKEAMEVLFRILEMGKKIQDENRGSTINYLYGMAIKNIGLVNIQKTITQTNLSASDIESFQNRIDSYGDKGSSLQEVFKMEYVMLKNTKEQMLDPYLQAGKVSQVGQVLEVEEIKDLSLPFKKTAFYYKSNETQKLFADQFEKFVQDAARKCNEIEPANRIVDTSSSKIYFTENAVGKILRDVMAVSIDGIIQKRCQEDFVLYSTKFMFATHAYKADNGAYPASMNQLSSTYLSNVLTQFDGKQVEYDSKNGTISIAQ